MKRHDSVCNEPFNIPVLLIMFNRIETTKKVLNSIRKAKVSKLYISGDGPRKFNSTDAEKVRNLREYVIANIDWECEIITLFHDMNLGCKYAPYEAISWFFKNEDMGIILEDDCFPSQSFFIYCQELLHKYKDDSRIMLISGYNKMSKWKNEENDYFFSNLGGIWGWASWKRAWILNDLDMTDLDLFIEQDGFSNVLCNISSIRSRQILKAKSENLDAWDFQWGFTRHKNNGLACVPSTSLIQNIGFGEDATHTNNKNTAKVIASDIDFPLRDNKFVVPDRKYDELFIGKQSFLKKSMIFLSKVFK